ncbi:MAG: radical SAM protein, partial [Nitrospirae bacterium]
DILRDEDILEKYKRAGVVHIYIGLEATDQSVLDMINKDIRVEQGIRALSLIHEHGMITETSFILGFPEETEETIKRTLELSKIYNPDFAHYLTLAPWPYADIYQQMKPYIEVFDYRKYNLIDPVIKPVNMTLDELDRAIVHCYQSFYMGKLKEVLSMEDPFKKRYMLTSMRLIMNSSFIVEKFGRLGRIPAQVENILRMIDSPEKTSDLKEEEFTVLARGSVHIERPVEEVFGYVSSPDNWPEFIPGLKEAKLKGPLAEGAEFDWTYRIKGVDLKGKGTVTEYKKNRTLSLQMYRFVPIGKKISFEPTDRGTLLMVEVGYKKPGKVMSFLFNAI